MLSSNLLQTSMRSESILGVVLLCESGRTSYCQWIVEKLAYHGTHKTYKIQIERSIGLDIKNIIDIGLQVGISVS